MNGRAAYIDLPNGKRMELSASIPDIEEVPGTLSDEEKALIEMLENEFETFVAELYTGRPLWKRRNLNIPERWKVVQDKRRNPSPLGRCSYLHKARKVKSLARSVHTRIAPHRGAKKGDVEQCKHTFKITDARCAPCNGYNTECEHYEKNNAADTKRGSSLA